MKYVIAVLFLKISNVWNCKFLHMHRML